MNNFMFFSLFAALIIWLIGNLCQKTLPDIYFPAIWFSFKSNCLLFSAQANDEKLKLNIFVPANVIPSFLAICSSWD